MLHSISRRVAVLAGTFAVAGGIFGTVSATAASAAVIPPLQPLGTALYVGGGTLVCDLLESSTGHLVCSNPLLDQVGKVVEFGIL